MIDIKVKPTDASEMTNREFETIEEGIYNVELTQFKDWVKGKDRKGDDYYRAELRLTILEGKYKGRIIFDNLFINEKTPEWVLGNFLASFTDGETVMNASDFPKLVGKHGRVSTENKIVDREVIDPETGIPTTVAKVYTNVRNFLRKEEKKVEPWNK